MKKLKVYSDGASRGNPGRASIGILIADDDGKEILTHKKFIGEFTNNVAEYSALIESVNQIKNSKIEFEEINFFCDSELIVKQIKGEYKIRNKDLMRLSLEFWREIKSMNKKFSITHIPREQNKIADKLANEALDESENINTDKSLLIN
ncbi:MAG: ribonuclease HI family protein [Bacteroidota bacterium]|nr:ribonuclease HI family protein [Bacteroidota bacterium]